MDATESLSQSVPIVENALEAFLLRKLHDLLSGYARWVVATLAVLYLLTGESLATARLGLVLLSPILMEIAVQGIVILVLNLLSDGIRAGKSRASSNTGREVSNGQ